MSQKRKLETVDNKLSSFIFNEEFQQHLSLLKEIDCGEDSTDNDASDYESDEIRDESDAIFGYKLKKRTEIKNNSDSEYESSESDKDFEEEDNADSENEDEGSEEENADSENEDEGSEEEESKSEDENSASEEESSDSENDDASASVIQPHLKLRNTKKSVNNSNNAGTSGRTLPIVSKSIKQVSSASNKNSVASKKKSVIPISKSGSSITKKSEYDDEDSSDEEDLRNTVGNIPLKWYDECPHIGYDLDGEAIIKPNSGDKLDKFLEQQENKDFYRTIVDKFTGQDVVLSDEDLDLLNRLMTHKVPDASYDMYQQFQHHFSHDTMIMPLSGRPDSKKSFLPPANEMKLVAKIAFHMRNGTYRKDKNKEAKRKPSRCYDLWKPRSYGSRYIRRMTKPIPPPQFTLPTHASSYNPPPEYLMNKDDERVLHGVKTNNINYEKYEGLKNKFKSVREIPMYKFTVKDCYEHLMNLNQCARKKYERVTCKSKDFLPDLPDKKDLRPFPTKEEMKFEGHQSIIRTISIHPNGKFLASGSDDHSVKIWEISTGRCLRTFDMEEPILKVSWNPNPKLFLIAVVIGKLTIFLSPETYLVDKTVLQQTNAVFSQAVDQGDYIVPSRIAAAVTWRKPTEEEWKKGFRLVVEHFKEIKSIVWHKQGDYFATVIPDGYHRSVLIHQLSRWRSQVPFSKSKGRVQCVSFHPKNPHLFVVTQTHIRLYDLHKTRLLKKVQANSRYISCIEVHPSGEHFIIGGFDRRTNWFEMEYTKRPHLMRIHGGAVRAIKFHRKYPMFASCSDDGQIIVNHSMVYDDWSKDPLIVPLKMLKGHRKFDDFVVLDLEWHPYEPYLFSAGADATIRLWH